MDFWTFYWGFVAFVFGAIVGSFLNVAIWRMPRGESVSGPPSHCPSCSHRLKLFPDMVPIVSQAWYRSRCRYCGERFSWRYAGVELLTAVVFTLLYVRYFVFGAPELNEGIRAVSAILAMLFAAALIVIFFIDLDTFTIPDAVVLAALGAAVGRDALLIAAGVRPLWQTVPGTDVTLPLPLSIVGAALAFWLLWQFAALMTALLNKEAMGAGDSTLLAAMGAFLIPWPLLLLAFLFAVALGTVGGLLAAWLPSRGGAGSPVIVSPGSGPAAPDPELIMMPPGPSLAEERAVYPDNEVASARPHARRGAAEVPAPAGVEGPAGEAEPEIPALPALARWGRVLTVLGTWAGVGGLWLAAAMFRAAPGLALTVGALGLLAAAGLLVYGIRIWRDGDEEWLPEQDELFEGDPGPRFIPFGPYLVTGTLLAVLFGEAIVTWYVTHQVPIWLPDIQRMPWE